MKIEKTERGFYVLCQETLPGKWEALVRESSIIGPYGDSLENPGSSFLYVGQIILNRKEVAELIQYLQHWLDNKRLALNDSKNEVKNVIK